MTKTAQNHETRITRVETGRESDKVLMAHLFDTMDRHFVVLREGHGDLRDRYGDMHKNVGGLHEHHGDMQREVDELRSELRSILERMGLAD